MLYPRAYLAAGVLGALLLVVGTPLRAQQPAATAPRQPIADTSCVPDYGKAALRDSAMTTPPCQTPRPLPSSEVAPTSGVERATPGQAAPLSAKGDSLRRQADSTTARQ